jgi:hypothetical protein
MKMIVRRMQLVVDRMDDLRGTRIKPDLHPAWEEQREIWERLGSVEAEDEILPVTCWPDSVVRH